MPSGNRKSYFRGSSQFSNVTISKISPLWKPEIEYFRHFSKLKISCFNEKILPISLELNFTPNTSGCYVLNGVAFIIILIGAFFGHRLILRLFLQLKPNRQQGHCLPETSQLPTPAQPPRISNMSTPKVPSLIADLDLFATPSPISGLPAGQPNGQLAPAPALSSPGPLSSPAAAALPLAPHLAPPPTIHARSHKRTSQVGSAPHSLFSARSFHTVNLILPTPIRKGCTQIR